MLPDAGLLVIDTPPVERTAAAVNALPSTRRFAWFEMTRVPSASPASAPESAARIVPPFSVSAPSAMLTPSESESAATTV